MKIANYIQSYSYQNKEEFYKAIKAIKDIGFDILALPELSYLPEDIVKHFKSSCKADKSGNKFIDSFIDIDIFNEKDIETLKNESLELSRQIGKAVVFGNKDKNGTIFSIFANAFKENDDTDFKYHIKHTQQGNNNKAKSVLEISSFKSFELNYNLQAIKYKGKNIALTICYDSTYSLFSYAYNVINKGIDIIINCTGGKVDYDKWYLFNKCRSLENECYTFLTMGTPKEIEENEQKDYSFGITPEGEELEPLLIYDPSIHTTSKGSIFNKKGSIYVYDLETPKYNIHHELTKRKQKSEYKNYNLEISLVDIDKKYYVKLKSKDISVIEISGNDIYDPKSYMSEIIDNTNCYRYVLVSRFDNDLNYLEFENKLSCILKNIATRYHIVVILKSPSFNVCYTPKENYLETITIVNESSYKIKKELTECYLKKSNEFKNGKRKRKRKENYIWLLNKI